MGDIRLEPTKGIALCLSGGGYRAALYHLGVLRRLNEVGMLGRVDTITAISGGSILGGLLATHIAKNVPEWPTPDGRIPGLEEFVIQPMREIAKLNIRTLSVLARVAPWNWTDRGATANALTKRYRKYVTSLKVNELPLQPRFIILATDMQFGDQWFFERSRVGSAKAGWESPPADDWTVPQAIAASCSVPAIFQPLHLRGREKRLKDGTYKEDDRDQRANCLDLSDGGIYDNLGLDPVWEDHRVVFVSDGSPHFFAVRGKNIIWRTLRQLVIVLDQNADVRKRWLSANVRRGLIKAGWVGIAKMPSDFDTTPKYGGYADDVVDEHIAPIRIDLDKFSDGEQAVLENHGYLMTAHVVDRYLSDELPEPSPPAAVPHPEWMDKNKVKGALRLSHHVSPLGRGRWR